MGSKVMQRVACAILCAGGVGLLAAGHVMGGVTAIGVGGLLALLTLGRRDP